MPPDRLQEGLGIEDYERLLEHLAAALATFQRTDRKLNSAEISAKSMLTVLHAELQRQYKLKCAEARNITEPPWEVPLD